MEISVVICTRDRPDRLAGALDSCCRQTVKPVQIIVIDDGDLAQEFIEHRQKNIRDFGIEFLYYHKPLYRRGLTISRNIGWRMARGEIIQFLDDDAELDENCLAVLGKVFAADANRQIAAVDFRIIEETRSQAGRRLIEYCYRMAGLWRLGRRFIPSRHLKVDFLQGGSLAVPKAVLEKINGFDETLTGYALGEDKEISFRLAGQGIITRINAPGVRHFSDPAGRIDSFQFGYETSFNYLYINSKKGPLGLGEALLLVYNLGMLLATEGLFALVGNRKFHRDQIAGLLKGIWIFIRTSWHTKPE